MGAILSNHRAGPSDYVVSEHERCKRRRISSSLWEENPRLIPCLPDEISIQILARLPRTCYLKAKSVSRSWKAVVTSSELYSLRKEIGTTEEWLYILTRIGDDKFLWYALDPLSREWQRLPLMPNLATRDECGRGLTSLRVWNLVGSSVRFADAVMRLFGRKCKLDQIPFCGCAIGAVDGCLYVLGGFRKATATTSVWRYDPMINTWNEVNPMSVGRAYCKTGVLNNRLYVVGGVSRGRGGLAPLQTAEVFDPRTGDWSDVPSMPFSKAQVLPAAFLTNFLKPIATGMTTYRGKLYVPQSLYCWPFFVDLGGEVYDPETNSWLEMPTGMGDGWPAKQAGTKLSVIVDGELYALDPSSSLDSVRIKVYDYQDDSWKVIEGDLPIRDLTDSESPYLLAGFLRKLHVITKDANQNITVMQVDRPNLAASSQPTSPASSDESSQEHPNPLSGSEPNIWKVISSKSVGSAELVSCQMLDL